MSRFNDVFVCSPLDYVKMNEFVKSECNDINNRWIYQIIDKEWGVLDEQVCLDEGTTSLVEKYLLQSAFSYRTQFSGHNFEDPSQFQTSVRLAF